jgi:hypothetical protein
MNVQQYYERVHQRADRRRENHMSDILRFQTNIPEEFSLKFSDGKEVEGNFGPQIMFSLEDGRKAFLPPIVETKFKSLGIGRGERVSVCKTEVKGRAVWVVKRVDPPAPRPAAAVPIRQEPQRIDTLSREALKTQLGTVLVNGLPPEYPDDPGPGNAYSQNGNGRSNGNGHSNGHQPPNPKPPAPSLMTGEGQRMLEQFISVYEVMVAVEKYSVMKERPVVFTSEDFRAAAISCCIDKSRNGGPR